MDELKDLFHGNIKLPSPPNIALRLLETLKKEDFCFNEIAGVIQSDPALSAKVLKVANSALYSLPDKTSSVPKALSVMGVHAVKNIALSFSLVEGVNRGAETGFNMNYFWKRSIIAAIGAELFAKQLGIEDDDIFVTALLQDLGILIAFTYYPEKYSRLIEEKNETRVPVEILEKRIFGFNHQEIASETLEQWGLPERIHVPIRYHHGYDEAPKQHRAVARILYLSHALSSIFSDTECFEKIRHFAGIIKEDLGIADTDLEALVDDVAGRIVEICSLYEIPAGNMKPLSKLLQEANEELSDLNISYEKLLVEYRKEKMQAERLAKQLQETNERLNQANRKLRETSLRDYLTGLYNRRYLIDFISREISKAERYGGCFALLMFDIDHFKKINDTWGHHTGDLVLKAVSDRATQSARETDLVARYGGEEFVVVMPGTDISGAGAFAERLRKALENMEIAGEGATVKVTASFGAASFCPVDRKMTVNELIDAADKALYEAKNAGRNRVVTAGTEIRPGGK